jgi:hypothetical protein
MSLNGVLQLKTLALRFSKQHTRASVGVRDAVLSGALAGWARAHPTVTVTTEAAANRSPCVSAAYADGTTKTVGMVGFDKSEVLRLLGRLRDTTTARRRTFRAPVVTTAPSVQGVWDAGITYKGFELRDVKTVAT